MAISYSFFFLLFCPGKGWLSWSTAFSELYEHCGVLKTFEEHKKKLLQLKCGTEADLVKCLEPLGRQYSYFHKRPWLYFRCSVENFLVNDKGEAKQDSSRDSSEAPQKKRRKRVRFGIGEIQRVQEKKTSCILKLFNGINSGWLDKCDQEGEAALEKSFLKQFDNQIFVGWIMKWHGSETGKTGETGYYEVQYPVDKDREELTFEELQKNHAEALQFLRKYIGGEASGDRTGFEVLKMFGKSDNNQKTEWIDHAGSSPFRPGSFFLQLKRQQILLCRVHSLNAGPESTYDNETGDVLKITGDHTYDIDQLSNGIEGGKVRVKDVAYLDLLQGHYNALRFIRHMGENFNSTDDDIDRSRQAAAEGGEHDDDEDDEPWAEDDDDDDDDDDEDVSQSAELAERCRQRMERARADLMESYPSEQLSATPLDVNEKGTWTDNILSEIDLKIVHVPGLGMCKREVWALLVNATSAPTSPPETAITIAEAQASYMRSTDGKEYLTEYPCTGPGARHFLGSPKFRVTDIEDTAKREHTVSQGNGLNCVGGLWADCRIDHAAMAKRVGKTIWFFQVGRDFVLRFDPSKNEDTGHCLQHFQHLYNEEDLVTVYDCIASKLSETEVAFKITSEGSHYAAALPTKIANDILNKRGK